MPRPPLTPRERSLRDIRGLHVSITQCFRDLANPNLHLTPDDRAVIRAAIDDLSEHLRIESERLAQGYYERR
jgi:hypothetical protein